MNRYMRIDTCMFKIIFFLWMLESGFYFDVY